MEEDPPDVAETNQDVIATILNLHDAEFWDTKEVVLIIIATTTANIVRREKHQL